MHNNSFSKLTDWCLKSVTVLLRSRYPTSVRNLLHGNIMFFFFSLSFFLPHSRCWWWRRTTMQHWRSAPILIPLGASPLSRWLYIWGWGCIWVLWFCTATVWTGPKIPCSATSLLPRSWCAIRSISWTSTYMQPIHHRILNMDNLATTSWPTCSWCWIFSRQPPPPLPASSTHINWWGYGHFLWPIGLAAIRSCKVH